MIAPRRAPGNPHLAVSAEWWGSDSDPLVVVGLHGRTQSPTFIDDLRRRVDVPGVSWLAPAAADSSWYPHRFMDEVGDLDPWLDWSLEAVDVALDGLSRQGARKRRVVLLGFSQGACLAAEYALRARTEFAGLVLLTGGFMGPERRAPLVVSGRDGMPAVIATIDRDPWVPLERTLETDGILRASGARVSLLVQPGSEHGVTDEAVVLVRDLLHALAGL